eukprot:Skav200555  [mRNA]  locus=scaffold2256:64036:66285:+ [translate_table: standard]
MPHSNGSNGANGATDSALVKQILHFVVPITGAYALEGLATLVPIWAAAHGGSPDENEATSRVGVWLEFQYDALRKFLMNQQIPSPGLWVLCATVPAHWATCVFLLESGISIDPLVAIGVAFSVRSAVSFVLLAGYMTLFQPTPSCVAWWRIWESKEALSWKGLKSYAQIAVKSVAMYGFDWWAYELLTLLAGGLRSETQLAAHVAATTASDWAFLVVRGAPKAATALVGAAMGQKDIIRVHQAGVQLSLSSTISSQFFCNVGWDRLDQMVQATNRVQLVQNPFFLFVLTALQVVKACLRLTFGMCGGLVIFCWFGRVKLTHLLLPDEPVTQAIFAKLLICVLLQLLVDGLNSCYSGVFAGLGRQGAVSVGLFTFQWVAQLPGAYILGYHFQMGALGLHLASMVSSVLNCGYNYMLMKRSLEALGPTVPMKDYEMLRRS